MIRVNIVDIPVARSSHTIPTPRAGGVAIIASFLFFIVLIDNLILKVMAPSVLTMIIISIGISGLGFIDDIKPLSYKIRLVLQAGLATLAVLNGLQLKVLVIPGFSPFELGPYAPYFSIIWIVGLMNAINFMDGLNGLVGGCTMIALAFMIYLTPMTQPLFYVFLGLFIATAGFMRYNFHYGRIFMGDVGSQFIGFIIACCALDSVSFSSGDITFFRIILLFFPLLYDVKFTFIRRALKGRSIFVPHREHLYQLLNRSGWTHDQVCGLYFSYSVLSGMSLLYLALKPALSLSIPIVYGILYTLHTFCILKYAQTKDVPL